VINIKIVNIILVGLILSLPPFGAIMAKQTITHYQLENQLSVVLVQDPSSPIVSARTYVKAGSIDEAPHLGSGLSHYLEHIVAGGSTTFHSEDVYKNIISTLGGAYNAYTTLDHTSYYINTTNDEVFKAVQTLYEWMFHCTFNTHEFERERNVIIKEIEKNNANIHRKFYHLAQKNTFKAHPIQHPVIGYLDSFKQIDRDTLIAYYQKHYVPANMILVVGGNFNIESIKKKINETFGSAPESAAPMRPYLDEPLPFSPRKLSVKDDSSISFFSIRFPTTTLFSEDLHALDLLEFILTHGENAILHQRIVEEKQLAFDISGASYTPQHTSGYFEISGETTQENIPKLKQELYEVINDIKKKKLPLHILKNAIKQKRAEDIFSVSHIEDKVSRYGLGQLYTDSPFFYDHYIDGFKDITPKDIQNVAQKYLNPKFEIVTQLTPIHPPTPTTSKTPSATHNQIEKIKLNDSITVLFKHDESLPKTIAQILTLGGIRFETKENNGIGAILSELLGKSSLHYSKQNILDLINGNGAQLNASMGNNSLYYQLNSLSEDFETLLPVFLDTYYHPKFSDDEIKESKRQLNKEILTRSDDWYSFGNYLFNKQFFGTHPYGLSLDGEKSSIESISEADIISFHKNLSHNDQTVISVMGQFNRQETLELLEQFFQANPITPVTPYLPTLKRTPHVSPSESFKLISQNVTGVFIGFDGIRIDNHRDELKVDLLDSVLSGMSYPSGRLHNLLREEGLVYMVHGHSRPGIETGIISIVALTSYDKVDRVKEIIFSEIESLKTNLVSEKEFNEGISQLKFHYENRQASLDHFVIHTSLDELYQKGFEHYLNIPDRINQLKPQDIQDMANRYLNHPQIMIISDQPKLQKRP
jgi:zinc protease